MQPVRHYVGSFLGTIAILFFSGCHPYPIGGSSTDVSTYSKILERAKKDKRYALMQSGVNFYTITSFDMNQAKREMTVTLDKADPVRLAVYSNSSADAKTPNVTGGSNHAVHIFMKDSVSYTLDEPHTIPIVRIARIELKD